MATSAENVTKAFLALEQVLRTSAFLRWRQLQDDFTVEVKSSREHPAFPADEGAFIRIGPAAGIKSLHGVYDLILARADTLWFAHFGDIERDAEVGDVFGGSESMPLPQHIMQWLDSDDVVRNHCRNDLEFDGFRVLRSLDIAYAGSGYEESFDSDEVAMLDRGRTVQELRDWVDDLEARLGVDVRDMRSRMEAYIRTGLEHDKTARSGREWFADDLPASDDELSMPVP